MGPRWFNGRTNACPQNTMGSELYEGVQKTVIVFAYLGNIATLFVSGALSRINFDDTHP